MHRRHRRCLVLLGRVSEIGLDPQWPSYFFILPLPRIKKHIRTRLLYVNTNKTYNRFLLSVIQKRIFIERKQKWCMYKWTLSYTVLCFSRQSVKYLLPPSFLEFLWCITLKEGKISLFEEHVYLQMCLPFVCVYTKRVTWFISEKKCSR